MGRSLVNYALRGGVVVGLVLMAAPAAAQTVPRRQIPPAVLLELGDVQRRFEAALAADCHLGTCFSKGCAYGEHAVLDRPRATSMPGLGDQSGPGSVEAQELLTRASCAFAHEASMTTDDAEALARRLQLKVSGGFISVSVNRQELPPLPVALRSPPVQEDALPPPAPAPPPPDWTPGRALHELWDVLLPHAPWMVAIALLTLATTTLVWAWRRVGRESAEEQALLAQLLREDAAPEPVADEAPDEDAAFVALQTAAWRTRLAASGPDNPDPELEALIREMLRARDLPMLAKATLIFPDRFLDAFPAGGEVASVKLELADYLKSVDGDALPDDPTFFRALERMARSSAIASQPDAELVRSLRDEFGPTGLADLFEQLPARTSALLLAMAPPEERYDVIALLSTDAAARVAGELLRSNRMHRDEASHVVDVLRAVRLGRPLPPAPELPPGELDSVFEAAGTVSALLATLAPAAREALFGVAVARHRGVLPRWHRAIVYADLVRALPAEARADVLLSADTEALAAWLDLQHTSARAALVDGLPRSLRVALDTAGDTSRARRLALADTARLQLAEGVQRQITAAGWTFEQVVTGQQVPA